MGRGVWTRRWLAASGGVLVNGLILGALILIEEPPPLLEEPPVIVLDLERPQKRTSPQRQAAAGSRSAAQAVATPAQPTASEGEGPPAVAAAQAPPAPPVDPEWTVDPKVVDRWRLLEGNPSMGIGRLRRACLGQTSEHMTPEEKEACYNSWGHRPDKRPTPNFIGPIDERKWEVPDPSPPRRPTSEDDKRQRRNLCRTVERMRKADPSMKSGLRRGAC